MDRIDTPTSGASGRIIPLVANVRRSVLSLRAIVRLVVLFHSILVWFLLVLRRTSRLAYASSTSAPAAGARKRIAVAEVEDSRRRRELAEAVEMVGSAVRCRSGTFDFVGPRKNSLYCRYWVPVSAEMR